MLTSAARYYRQQQRLTALGVRASRRVAVRGPVAVAASVGTYQAASATLAASSASLMLEEQGIPDEPVGRLNSAAFVTGRAVTDLLDKVATDAAFDRLMVTLVQDAGRTAMGVATTVRPNVTGHVRYLNPPSCPRCAVLAGRFYRWSDGFQRHPRCDCQMVPSDRDAAEGLIGDPTTAFEKGQVRGLSVADTEAIDAGADISQVVNVRRSAAGLRVGSSVIVRNGRLTPAGINRVASDRVEAIALLKQYGYIL